jgi:ABC-type bacteriocin/lantibiotic exporter with double-glycine peptidase domain
MPAKPPLYRQETEYSCAPACLRMVLASFGLLKTEQELCVLCDCAALGTDAFKLVEAARKLGFINTRKYNLTLDELKAELDRGLYPIVYVRAQLAPDTPFQEHAIVVTEITEDEVRILDPTRGRDVFFTSRFLREWELMRRLTILVE